jgi:hypothetical protein
MAMATEVTDERLAAIKTTVEKAHRELGEVCSAGVSRRWRMSIPADFTRDSDLIIGDGLRAAHDLAAEVERLRAELARLSAVPAADVERLREALATRERQLSYAVAGMGQGKEGTFFAVKDEAGRVCDVVMAKLSSAHGCVQPAELAPIAASPASGAALNMADFDPTGIELPPELQTSDELARRIAAYALGIGDTAAGVWCTRALSNRMELLGPGGFTMTALLPASPGAIDIMATVQDIADRMNASPPSPAPTGTADPIAPDREARKVFDEVFPKGYKPKFIGAHQAVHPQTLRKVMEDATVPDIAHDVIAGLIWQMAIWDNRARFMCEEAKKAFAAKDAAEAVLAGQTAGGVEGGWVAVKDRVPDAGARVITFRWIAPECPSMDFANWEGGEWQNYNWHRSMPRDEIDYWREAPPLPPSPPAPTTDQQETRNA